MSSGERLRRSGVHAAIPGNCALEGAPTIAARSVSEAPGGSEDVDLARLAWRSRRGLLELDLWLGGFAQRQLSALTPAERRQYEALLELPDPELLELLQGRRESPLGLAALIRRIQQT